MNPVQKIKSHDFFLQAALKLAQKAAQQNEVPIGCVITHNNQIIAQSFNSCEAQNSALKHAELTCLEQASLKQQGWRLTDCHLYVTLEPCPMCLGAIIQARIKHLIFGCYDQKRSAPDSFFKSLKGISHIHDNNHHLQVTGGILEKDCSKVLIDFFKTKRQSSN